MNFDFSEELNQVRAEARAFLAQHAAGSARRALEGGTCMDRALWAELARLGWIGAAIPEEFGGSGLGDEGLCVLAEEIGRAVAPVPFASTAYLASQAVLRFGTPAQKQAYLPGLADGSLIGCLALHEGLGAPAPAAIQATLQGGALSGTKFPVIDGTLADIAIVAAREGGAVVLAIADLRGGAVPRESLQTIDPTRDAARINFTATPAERLPGAARWDDVLSLLDRAAVFTAFEQIGGAQACLEMARDYALQRHAFGRQIGSFQAIKHKLADIYVAIELARSNAYYGAWALGAGGGEMPHAGAAARVAAIAAFQLASAENIQTHGGMGFTWESDCHLYYRRAKHLALALGAAPFWKDRLVGAIAHRNEAA